MFSRIISGGVLGVNGYIVIAEIDISQGLPSFEIVGLPDSTVKESRERVRTAIKNSNIPFPIKKITVNLAPADTRKEGSIYDLPIACGILGAINVISNNLLKEFFILGELSLDGYIRPVSGVLPMILSAKENNIKNFIVPFKNLEEASLVKDINIIGVKSINQLIKLFSKPKLEFNNVNIDFKDLHKKTNFNLDFSDVKGQEDLKRALEIAAAGNHNLLMIGPPGSGKTMLAKRFPTILPSLTFDESLEVTKIYSVSGIVENKGALLLEKPFRAPHHTASFAALVGGGRFPKPGEVSLAHFGVLFLDEFTEFNKNSLESLRQPLENNEVTVSRVGGTITYPSNFILLASMNPCPCGYFGSIKECTCTQNEITKYLNKISGPLLDRIDIQAEAIFVDYKDLQSTTVSESSSVIKERVIKARNIQRERYKEINISTNSELSASQINKFCKLSKEENEILKLAFDNLQLSARAYHKILKVARTIADLHGNQFSKQFTNFKILMGSNKQSSIIFEMGRLLFLSVFCLRMELSAIFLAILRFC